MIFSLLTFFVAYMPFVLKFILLMVTNSLGSSPRANGTHFSWAGDTNNVTLENSVEWISGTYTYTSSDNFESYLKELGVSYFLRKLALLATPVVSLKYSQVSAAKN